MVDEFEQLNFGFIGSNPPIADNSTSLGYVSNYEEYNKLLNASKSFVYIGYNDPAPKTVCHALICHIPMLLTNSGGNKELAREYAVYLEDKRENIAEFHDKTPELDEDLTFNKFKFFFGFVAYVYNRI